MMPDMKFYRFVEVLVRVLQQLQRQKPATIFIQMIQKVKEKKLNSRLAMRIGYLTKQIFELKNLSSRA